MTRRRQYRQPRLTRSRLWVETSQLRDQAAGAPGCVRSRLVQPAGQDRNLGLGLCECDPVPADQSGAQEGTDFSFARSASLKTARVGTKMSGAQPALEPSKSRRRDAHDCVGRPSECEASADAGRVSREPPLPEAVAQDDDVVMTGGRVFGREEGEHRARRRGARTLNRAR